MAKKLREIIKESEHQTHYVQIKDHDKEYHEDPYRKFESELSKHYSDFGASTGMGSTEYYVPKKHYKKAVEIAHSIFPKKHVKHGNTNKDYPE